MMMVCGSITVRDAESKLVVHSLACLLAATLASNYAKNRPPLEGRSSSTGMETVVLVSRGKHASTSTLDAHRLQDDYARPIDRGIIHVRRVGEFASGLAGRRLCSQDR